VNSLLAASLLRRPASCSQPAQNPSGNPRRNFLFSQRHMFKEFSNFVVLKDGTIIAGSKYRLKKPRWVQRLIAFFGGYFWLPCPICGRKFGGHEPSGTLIKEGHVFFPAIVFRAEMTCSECVEEAKKRSRPVEEECYSQQMKMLTNIFGCK